MIIRLVLLLLLTAGADAAEPRFVVLDVGEGQALLLQRDHHGMLIDTGHPGHSAHLLGRLHHRGVTRLDGLILTHLHPDHAGGYFRLREAFPKAPVMDNCHPFPRSADAVPDLVRWVNEALEADPSRRCLRAGEVIDWRGLRIEVLWPTEISGRDMNRNSLVLLITHGDNRLLVMGDTGKTVERQLLADGKAPAGVELYVSGHHGAADTADPAFLQRIRPGQSVISVNADNLRGYPAAVTVQTLENHSGRLLRTDRDGELCWSFPAAAPVRPCNPGGPARTR